MKLLTMASLTFREASRKKLMWLALGLGGAFLVLFGLGMHFILQEIAESSGRRMSEAALRIELTQASGLLLLMGLFVVNFLIVMMTALTSAGALPGEISSHTIQTIATKPIRRRDILLGKWLGHGMMIMLYILFMFGGLTLVTFWISDGYMPPNMLPSLSLLILEGLIVLSLAFFGGTFLPTLANGVLVFMLYGVAFIGSWVEQIGAAMESETAVQIGIIASLIMPSETMWRLVSDLIQPPLVREMGASPFMLFSQPSNAMIVYALIYMIALVGGALYQFGRRDL